jgi:tRNA A-37 threonylcarbamoyl transferase component Bud32
MKQATQAVRWEAAPELAKSGLLGPDGPRLTMGQVTVIKHAPHCAIYHVVLPGLDVHVKHYRPGDAKSRVRAVVWVSKARAEAERTRAVAARGVPAPQLLAVGQSAEGSYLVTRTVAGARPLTAFLEEELPRFAPVRQARVRQALAAALGRFLARMHAGGVLHADLHPGNLLLRLTPDDQPELYLIDLYAVRLGPPLDWRPSRDNLVVLNRWFVLRASRSDRLRCWRAYCDARAHAAGFWRSDNRTREIERNTSISNLRFWRAKDRRCLGGNRWFRRVRFGSISGCAVADLDPAAVAPLLADPDEPFRRPGVGVLKNSSSSTVIEFDLPVGGALRRVIYKRFAVTRWTDPWAALVRPAPALRSYVLGHGLRMRGLPTPRPLAVWHRTRLGLLLEGYLLTEKVPDAVDLPTHVARLARLPVAERRGAMHRLIDHAARLIAALHERRLSHRDLKGPNLLVNAIPCVVSARGAVEAAAPPGASPCSQIWFIDLVGVRVLARLSAARRVQNLARLYASFHGRGLVTQTELLRFLRAYLAWGQRDLSGWKAWHRSVGEAFQAKLRRNRRSGRPLA